MFSRLFASKQSSSHSEVPARTPSPLASVVTIVDNRGSMSPQSKPNKIARSPSPTRTKSNNDLLELLKSVPPQVLHDYVTKRLNCPTITADEQRAVAEFFLFPSASGRLPPLVAPPRLHCARCHENYWECENNTRSCVMVHDDDSAEVAHVGWNNRSSEKETTYGCCGQVVDGEGDLGPPAGWCFEGRHCPDRAFCKYRADADEEDDRLESCEQRRCFRQSRRGQKRTARQAQHEHTDPTTVDTSDPPPIGDAKAHGQSDQNKKKKRKLA